TLHASSWTYSFLPADWVRGDAFPDGRQYELRVRARDKAGNQGTFPNTLTSVVRLTFDGAKPISGIVTPAAADDAIVNTLASITGTASDPLVNSSSSGVKAVSLIIQDVGGGIGCNTNFYWDAAANGGLGDWSPTVVFNPTAFNPGNGEWTWSSASMDLRLGVDCKYVIISSATDRAGNGQGTASQTMTSWKRLQFQPPPAVTAITAPTAIHYNDLKLFAGTANGNTVRVEVQLKRHDTGQCWGGTLGMGWVSCSGAVGASTGTRVVYPAVLAWNYPLTGELIPQWIDKTTYTFSSRGRNNADIAEQPPLPPGFPRTVDFYIDQSSPTSNLVYPANNAYIRTPPTLTGTVYDSGNGVAVSTASGIKDPNGILVNVKRKDAGPSFNYSWNHVTQLWDAPAYFSTATYYAVGSTWSFTAVPSSAVWLNGLVYEIQTQGIDKAFGAAAGNTEVPGAARTFTYDVALPTATIQTLNAGTTYSAVLASGTVADAAPGAVDYVQLLIKDHGTPTLPNDQPGYWDGT
ncbi:MAG: hypothetical protein AAB578_04740, partial [Elusimicrobiota bacterium]